MHCDLNTKTSRLKPVREIISVCSENRMEDTLSKNIKVSGIYSYGCVLKD
jgi:hypothetical protein